MGWTSYHRDKGETNAEHFGKLLSKDTEMVAHGTVGTTFYAAVHDQKTGEVFALVFLTQWAPNSYYNFTYKDMTETMGPVQSEAPANVLDALTPTDNEYALVWRERCRANLAQRAALRGLLDGDQVVLANALKFTDGSVLDTFTIRRWSVAGGKRTKAVLTHDGQLYHLPRWQAAVVAVLRDGERRETPLGHQRAAAV